MTRPAPVVPTRLSSLLTGAPPATDHDGTRVWAIVPDDVGDDDLTVARRWLDADEQQRSSRFVRDDLRRDYEVAHAALRLVVATVLGQHPAQVSWSRGLCPGCGELHGRPTTVGVEFSLSHTAGLALVAVAQRPVGVDVERVGPLLDDVVEALHPREVAEIRAAPGSEQAVWFTRAWTRSEAYLKGLGIGLGRSPGLDHVGADERPVRWVDGWIVRDVAVPDGWTASVANPAPARGQRDRLFVE